MSEVWTVGHSTLDAAAFVELLTGNGITTLVDVRRYPGSRRHPQFNKGALEATLKQAGIAYRHEPRLGGHRDEKAGSHNVALSNPFLVAYADHMESEEFAEGLAKLEELARASPTACMCAERDWTQCHRQLLSDALKARAWNVLHIRGDRSTTEHPYTSAASVVDGRPSYRGLF